ncbi:MAG: ATP-binding cassette domain-containing protein [Maritimibacter sp.]
MNAKPDFSRNANHAATAPAFFSVHDMHAYYGESYIVQGVSFNIHEGEILALLGRNGAGKTSTLRAIARTGSPMVTHGEIWLDHKPLHRMKSYDAAQAGLALVPEDRRIIQGLTVEENLELARIAPNPGWEIERVYELFPRLGERRKPEGVTLSGGEQQMLAIGRALVRDIKLLLLLALADRAVILDTGTIVFDGSAQEVLDNETLRHDYLAI